MKTLSVALGIIAVILAVIAAVVPAVRGMFTAGALAAFAAAYTVQVATA
jgi:hypothetical protein